MAFDGNGNWISNFSAVEDRDADIKILASRFDDILLADIAESFDNCVTRDGQGKMSTNFNANNHRVINVSNPEADKDAVNRQTLVSKVPFSIGSNIKPVYTNASGVITASNANVGSASQPIYMEGGEIKALTGTISNNAATATNSVTKAVTDSSVAIATTEFLHNVLNTLYPVGSIYIGTQASCPLSTLISGSTWVKVEGRYLLASGTLNGTSETYSATNTVGAGLPDFSQNIGYTGSEGNGKPDGGGDSGGIYPRRSQNITVKPSTVNNIYGASATVRPVAYVVNVWRRTA